MNITGSHPLRTFGPLVFGTAVLAFGILLLAQPGPISGVTDLETVKTITLPVEGFFDARDHVVGATLGLVGAGFVTGCSISELRRRGKRIVLG